MACDDRSQIDAGADFCDFPEEDEGSSSLETYLNAMRDEDFERVGRVGDADARIDDKDKESKVVYEENYVNPMMIDNTYPSETLRLNLIPDKTTVCHDSAKVLHFRSMKLIISAMIHARVR